MPNLFLQTETDPGEAEWGPAPDGGGDTLLLVIEIAADGAAPAIDPDGLRNICYVMAGTVNAMTAALPPITPTLGKVWRITVAGGADGASCAVSADAGDTIINVGTAPAVLHGTVVEGGAAAAANGIFVHDGANSWAVWGDVQSS